MAKTIGEAYLQIRPSMEGVQGELEQAMGEAGAKSSSAFGSAFSTGLKAVGGAALAAATAAVTTAVAGVTKLTQEAVSSYADFEQLTGGIETLFGTGGVGLEEYAASIGKTASEAAEGYVSLIRAQEFVMNNADMAFKTAGLSANKYMETVTSFSASLLQSTAGDTMLAAEIADQAIIDMADNANKMGSSMESIQNAYQGFAKQNYTMLDNLKLGYGGTKEEMERLLADASALSGVEYKMSNLADVYNAIHVIQENMGIAGTTAKEAEETISGSLASVGAAWKNLVAGLANPDADLGELIQNVVETGATALNNLIPTVLNALSGITEALPMIIPVITQNIPLLVQQVLPLLVQAIKSLLEGLVAAFPELINVIVAVLPDMFMMLVDTILSMLPEIIKLGIDLILALVDGITKALPDIINGIISVTMDVLNAIAEILPTLIPQLVEAAINALNALLSNVDLLVETAINLIMGLTMGIINALPILIEALPQILEAIVNAIVENLPIIIDAGIQIIGALVEAILGNIGPLIAAGIQMLVTLIGGILNAIPDLLTTGAHLVIELATSILKSLPELVAGGVQIIGAIIRGITDTVGDVIEAIIGMINALLGVIADFADSIFEAGVDIVTNIMDGIDSIGKNAAQWGKDLIDNFVGGIKDKFNKVKDTITDLASTIKSLLGFSEPEAGPLSNFHTFAPDMMELFASGIKQNLGLVTDAMGAVTGTLATDFRTAQIAPTNYSAVANPNEDLTALLGQNMAVDGGNITIPVYIGQEKLDTIILNAQQRHALVSGGR